MPAATQDVVRPRRAGPEFGYPVAANARVWRDTLAAIRADGTLVPAGTAGGVAVVGLPEQTVDNRDGPAPSAPVRCRRGVFAFAAVGVAPASIGAVVYALDDNTVTTDGTGGRLRAGVVVGIEAVPGAPGAAWVEV